jgi:hypothetical protein
VHSSQHISISGADACGWDVEVYVTSHKTVSKRPPNQIVMKTIDGSSQAPGPGKPLPEFRAPGVLFDSLHLIKMIATVAEQGGGYIGAPNPDFASHIGGLLVDKSTSRHFKRFIAIMRLYPDLLLVKCEN